MNAPYGESVILSLAHNVTACPWPALANKLMLMLALGGRRAETCDSSREQRADKAPVTIGNYSTLFARCLPDVGLKGNGRNSG